MPTPDRNPQETTVQFNVRLGESALEKFERLRYIAGLTTGKTPSKTAFLTHLISEAFTQIDHAKIIAIKRDELVTGYDAHIQLRDDLVSVFGEEFFDGSTSREELIEGRDALADLAIPPSQQQGT